jgi:beta-lactamase regulating signal transducer with metallopeptidase domain
MSLPAAVLVDVTVVILLALAAARVLRRRSAALRHAMLAAAVVAATIAPALEAWVPQIPVFRLQRAVATVASVGTLESSVVSLESDVVAPAALAAPISLGQVALATWAFGAAVMLAVLLLGLARLWIVTARSTPVREGTWRQSADELAATFGLRRRVGLLEGRDASVLATFGLFRPKILLPAGARDWPVDRVAVVLAHELAHVRRWDAALQLAAEALRVVHWFNPLVWIACRRLRQESEYACDDAVLRGGVEPAEYATHLLGIARHTAGRHHAMAAAIAHPSTLERRIAAMLTDNRRRGPLTRRASALTLAGAVMVAIPVTAMTIADELDSSGLASRTGSDVALPQSTVATVPAEVLPVTRPAAVAPVVVARPAAAPARMAESPDAGQSLTLGGPIMIREPQVPTTTTFSGTVLDQTGAVLPGAAMTLLADGDFGIQRVTVSDGNGRFAFREVQPGRYHFTASLAAFATVTNVVTLVDGPNLNRTITLPLGAISQLVRVVCSTAAAGPSQTSFNLRLASSRGARATRPAVLADSHPRLALFGGEASAQAETARVSRQPVRVGGVVRPPRRITSAPPVCPRAFLPADGAIVTLTARVGVDGFITDLRQVPPTDPFTAPPPEFVESAMEAIRQWEFLPTLLNGEETETDIKVTVQYSRR